MTQTEYDKLVDNCTNKHISDNLIITPMASTLPNELNFHLSIPDKIHELFIADILMQLYEKGALRIEIGTENEMELFAIS